MNDDPFEASLDKLFEQKRRTEGRVAYPTWERAWLIDGCPMKLAIRNKPGSAKPFEEVNIDFITGLGIEPILSKGIVHLTGTKAASSVKQNIRDLRSGFCAFLAAEIDETKATCQ